MANRFQRTHDAIAANPAPIERQIACIVSEIERFARFRANEIARRNAHPHWGATRLHELRSVLVTLQQIQRQRAENQESTAR